MSGKSTVAGADEEEKQIEIETEFYDVLYTKHLH
jgi:hypothetical protein